ncbi:MAG: hypothetical protein ACI4HN_03835, partial [Ruminococcus sp.]
MKKRIMSIILSVAMTFSCLVTITSFSASAEETTEESVYTIAGNKEDIFGLIWYEYITEDNTMQKSGDVYVYELKDVQVQTDIEFKIIEHTPDGKTHEYGDGPTSHGDFRIFSEFRVAKACDVTITFNPDTKEINVLGDGVREIKNDIYRVYAYSMYSDTFGTTNENPFPLENEMTLGDDGVYSVTFKDVQPEEDLKINISEEYYGDILLGFYGYNYCGIDVVTPCDVTVYFKKDSYSLENSKIWAEGDGVVIRTKPLIGEMHILGSQFSYNVSDKNKMTQSDDYVYQYRADNLNSESDYRFHIYNVDFKGNKVESWNGNFETQPAEFGVDKKSVVYPYQYGNSSMHFKVPYNNASVLITLDLTNYDYVS